MQILRTLLLALVFVTFSFSAWGDEKKCAGATSAKTDNGTAKLKGTVDLLGAVQIVHNTSPDKHAETVIFRNLVAAVGGGKGNPLVDKRVVSLEFALEGSGQELVVPHILRGYVMKTAKANPVLLIQAAGHTTLVDLTKYNTEKTELLHTFHVKVPASGSYHITLVLLADRSLDVPEISCYLGIDTLDFDLMKGKSGEK